MIQTPIMLEVDNVTQRYGGRTILNQVSLKIAAGQVVALVGPSGCGKSTLLRAILGTHPPQEGRVIADGVEVTRPSRHVGIVYQDYGLYEFLTCRDNVAFGLMLDETALWQRWIRPLWWRRLREVHRRSADTMLERVKLGSSGHLYPSEMSGGMRQRVAIAQSLIMQPKILLLDEPFGALDEATREELQLVLLHLYRDNQLAITRGEIPPYTILIVTHELNEAIYVADRVVGLSQYHSDGKQGARIVYDKPAPVYRPDEPVDFEHFSQQKEELRQAVFDPENLRHHAEYVTFWREVAERAQAAHIAARGV